MRITKLLATLLLAAFLLPLPVAADDADWDIPNGHFFTQTGGGSGKGYAVTDDGGVKFWSEFRRLGGVQAVGYPASERFTWDGFVSQSFQRVVFQWHPETQQAYFVNVFDLLNKAGKDDWLLAARQTPKPATWSEAGLSWNQIVARRLAVLDAYPAIKKVYYAVPGDAVTMNGLPGAPVTDMGNALVLRAQRVVIQQWKENVPWAAKGQVTVANGGDIAKELGLIPADAAAAWAPTFDARGRPTGAPPSSTAAARNKILFLSNRAGPDDVYMMNPDGSDLRRLTTSAGGAGASLSPDGTRLVYDAGTFPSAYHPKRQIFSMNVDGSDARQLTNNSGETTYPTHIDWTPAAC